MSTTDQQSTLSSPKTSQSSLIIATISVVLSLGAMGLSAHTLYGSHAKNEQLKTLSTAMNENVAQQDRQLQSLQKKISQLESNQQGQLQHLIAQISYLVHLANLNLMVKHNSTKALSTLTLAQSELASIHDASLTSFKNALNADIAALQAAPVVPITQLFSEIAAVNQSIEKLSPIPTSPDISLQKTINEIKSNDKPAPWYRRFLESLKQVKTLFIVRHLNQPNTPLILPAFEMSLKQNITMQLNMAQWALLHHDAAVYASALQSVSQWLTQYFALQPENAAILKQIADLQKVQINPTLPTLNNTLTALSEINIAVAVITPQPTAPQAPPAANPTAPLVAPTTPAPTPKNSAPKNDSSSVET